MISEKKTLGISAYFHDSAVGVIISGKVMAAAQEERFIRDKHTAAFPANSIRFCLDEVGLKIDDLDAVVFYDKPLLKFERILESDYSNAPKGLFSFLKSTPDWIGKKLFLRKELKRQLLETVRFGKKNSTYFLRSIIFLMQRVPFILRVSTQLESLRSTVSVSGIQHL